MIVLPKAARSGHKRPPGPSQRRPQRCQIPGIQTAENDLKSLTLLADAAVGQDVGVVVMRGGGWDRAQIHLLLGLAEAQPRGGLLAPQSRKSRASQAPAQHRWQLLLALLVGVEHHQLVAGETMHAQRQR